MPDKVEEVSDEVELAPPAIWRSKHTEDYGSANLQPTEAIR